MKSEFYFNIALLILINIVIKPIYIFGIEAEVQNVVGTRAWGVYFELFILGSLFQMIHDPGIHSYNTRTVAREPSILDTLLPRILGAKLILGCLFFAVVSLVFWILDYDPSLYTLLAVLVINHFLSSFFMYLRSNIAAIGQYRTDSLLSALDKVIMIILVGAMLYLPSWREGFDVLWLALGQLVAYTVACLVALWLTLRHVKHLKISLSWKYLGELLPQTMPYALVLLFMTIYTRIDGVMLGRILEDGNYQAGVYGACYRILDAMNMIGYLVASLLLPMLSSYRDVHDELRAFFLSALKVLTTMGITLGAAVIYYREVILSFIYDHYTSEFSAVMLPLILGFVAISISYIFGAFLQSRKDLYRLNVLCLTGIIINVAMNIYLIPRYAAVGAAWATFATEAMMLVGQILIVRRYRILPLGSREWLRMILFAILATSTCYLIATSPLIWWAGLVCCGVLGIIWALLTGMIEKKSLLEIVRKR